MQSFITSLSILFQPETMLLMIGGVFFGILLGAFPGLTATTAIILALPLTFAMSPEIAFPFLMSIYVGGISGGLIPAILLRIPGTPSSIATTFDGYPMAQRGEGGKALGLAFAASLFGMVISWLCLIIIAPSLGRFALTFGPHEQFMLILLAMTSVISLTGKNPIKGFIAATVGLLLATVGKDPIAATMRIADNSSPFAAGFAIVPALVGMYGISEILSNMVKKNENTITHRIRIREQFTHLRLLLSQKLNIIRSGLIGVFIGIIPALGGNVANLVAYDQAKRASKSPEKFGTGVPDGVIASETSNNAVIGGALVPLFTLGIPGDGVTAILFGALLLHGLQPGPMIFSGNPELMYTIYGSLLLSSFLMFIIGTLAVGFIIRALRTPNYMLFPIILSLCIIGAYSVNNNLFDIWTLLIFGAIGFLAERRGFPLAPLILGIILGPLAEMNFRRALMVGSGDYSLFLTRPISLVIFILTCIMLVLAIRTIVKSSRAQGANPS